MKLLPTTRVRNDDSLGRGMDAAITLVLFMGLGFLLDRWLGTTPWFMIGLSLLAGVGLFLKLKYSYDLRMEHLEQQRVAGQRASVTRRSDDSHRSAA